MSAELERIRAGRAEAHRRLLETGSPVYAAFLEMERAAFSEGRLSRRIKELVAVGISVAVHCQPCMEWHIGQARKAGADAGQVLEAVEVGMEMGGGPATVSARFALQAMVDVFDEDAVRRAGRAESV